MKAVWRGATLAESDDTVIAEGNHYFPPDALRMEHFAASERRSVCPRKGLANYFDITVDGEVNRAAAWYYAAPSQAAEHLKGRVAFWKGIKVVE